MKLVVIVPAILLLVGTIAILGNLSYFAPGTYYDKIDKSATGTVLKDALSKLISSNTKVLSYDQLWDAFWQTDANLVGSGCSGLVDEFSKYCWQKSQQCGNYQQEGQCYNREHFWPKSWWGGSSTIPAYTDLHHIFPTDGYVNGRRANYVLGKVTKVTYQSSNGCKVGTCDAANNYGFSGTCFEPADAFKGEAARVYFYMATRYQSTFTCCDEDGVNGAKIDDWLEKLLKDWNKKFPVSDAEKQRNDRIFTVQGNRNPFTDYPEWVDRIDF